MLPQDKPAAGALKVKCVVVLAADSPARDAEGGLLLPPAPSGWLPPAPSAANAATLAAAVTLVEPGPSCLCLAGLCLANLGIISRIHLPQVASARCMARWRCLVVELLDGGVVLLRLTIHSSLILPPRGSHVSIHCHVKFVSCHATASGLALYQVAWTPFTKRLSKQTKSTMPREGMLLDVPFDQ